MAKPILEIMRCSHRKIFKVCLAILQYYAWKGWRYFWCFLQKQIDSRIKNQKCHLHIEKLLKLIKTQFHIISHFYRQSYWQNYNCEVLLNFWCKRTYAIAKIIHFHLSRTVKKHQLNPKPLLVFWFDIFWWSCTIVSSYCNVVCGSLIYSNSQSICHIFFKKSVRSY